MPLTTNLVEYETDGDKICSINIKYEEDNNSRINEGGFDLSNNKCMFTIPRKWLKPRYIDYLRNDKVVRIYYKTQTEWKNDINSKKDEVVRACGECLSCTAIGALYTN